MSYIRGLTIFIHPLSTCMLHPNPYQLPWLQSNWNMESYYSHNIFYCKCMRLFNACQKMWYVLIRNKDILVMNSLYFLFSCCEPMSECVCIISMCVDVRKHTSAWTKFWLPQIHYLTHWSRDKMAAIFQTTYLKAFSWMKMYEFWLKFHWSLFLRIQLTTFQHWFR